jgi:hypothetical protein
MLKTYIGPFAQGVEVVIAGVSYGILKPGDSLALSDEVANQVAWSDEIWQDETPVKNAEKSK